MGRNIEQFLRPGANYRTFALGYGCHSLGVSMRSGGGDLFAQRKRLADAERKLQPKTTKAAENDARIARNKVEALTARLAGLKRKELVEDDYRIFPFWYAPIVINEDGRSRIVLARYHLRQAHQPETIDRKFPGLYNARGDNLTKFWRNEFAHTHAVMLIDAFFENVEQPGPEGTPRNVVLKFEPKPSNPMAVACFYAPERPRWLRALVVRRRHRQSAARNRGRRSRPLRHQPQG